MLVSCPKCQAKYDIDEKLISDKGKKLRCAKCENVWTVTKNGSPESDADILAKIGGRVIDIAEDKPVEEIEEEPVVSGEDMKLVAETVVDDTKQESVEEVEKEPEISEPAALETPEVQEATETPKPAEIETTEPEAPKLPDEAGDKDDMKEIFARISSKTEDIFKEEKKLPIVKKVSNIIVRSLGLQTKLSKIVFLVFLALILAASLIVARFSIVKYFPFMEIAYGAIGMPTVVLGEGLEFQNVTRREFEEDYVSKMEIKGFIVNTTEERRVVPPIYVEMMDKDANLLESMHAEAMVEIVEAGDRVAFVFVIVKPSSIMKYVVLTFKNENKQ